MRAPGIESEDFDEYLTNGLARTWSSGWGTRGAVDAGLKPERQVGLTGKIVGPNLYFAVGLSGAIQHMAGCSGSKNIVAVNIDENAQIFRFAKFGIVGDYKQVLPPLIESSKSFCPLNNHLQIGDSHRITPNEGNMLFGGCPQLIIRWAT